MLLEILFALLFVAVLTVLILIFGRIIVVESKLQHFFKVPGVPIFENYFILSNIKDNFVVTLNWMRTYGTIFKVSVFKGFSALIITDVDFIEQLLGTSLVLNKSATYSLLDRWLGTGLLTATEEKWKKTRKIITPAFHFQILQHYVETFHSASTTLIEKLRKEVRKGPFDIYPYITLCALDIICESAMGIKVNAQENPDLEYVKGIKELCRIVIARTLNPFKFLQTYYLTKDYQTEKYYLKILHDYTNAVIRSKKLEMEKSSGVLNKKERLAFLDLLLRSEIDGRPLTDSEIRQEVDTFMFEGHDTTAAGITFTLYCLAKHPDVQEKVVEEIEKVLDGNDDAPINVKQLNEMKYLEMVVKESLRLYPPVPIIGRMPQKHVTLKNMFVPKMAQLMIPIYVFHRNEKIYPEPEVFDPERFSAENRTGSHPFSYLAFSAGPRNCIGQKFAMLEMKSTITHILRNFVIRPMIHFEPQLVPMTVLKSLNGVMVQLEDRS